MVKQMDMIWAPVAAHMNDWDHMSDHMSGWGWGMMGALWLFVFLIIGLVVWGIWAAVRRGSGRSTRGGALAVLEERFARGDISPEEYRERREVLEER